MEEKKQQKQMSSTHQSIECSKCHKQVSSADGAQKPNGFVCNECISKRKKQILLATIGGVVVVVAIIVWIFSGNSKRTGEGFEGVGEIQDSISLSVNANEVKFDLSTATAVSSPVSTQAPISNLADFKNVFAQNVADATNENAQNVVIPSVSPLFEINTDHFINDGEALVREFAAVYNKTNKEAAILVEGFTCDLGGIDLNNKLSEVRAETVKKILVNAGIPENKIEVKWYGKSRFNEFKYSDKSEYRRVILSVK